MIEGFWIVNRAGLCMYHFETEAIKQVNANLFGGLLKAIDQLSEEIGAERLESTQMGNLRLYHKTRSKILFVLAVSSSIPTQNAIQVLNQLADRFFLHMESWVWDRATSHGLNPEAFLSFDDEIMSFTEKKRKASIGTESKDDLSNIFKKLVDRNKNS